MSRKILFLSLLILITAISFLPTQQTDVEPLYEIELDFMIKSSYLDEFDVEIDLDNTNTTVVLNEDPTFHFAFYHNVCFVENFYGYNYQCYGLGRQPQFWWDSREVDFGKYGDLEEHFLETRLYGSLCVYIDDMPLGLSSFMPDSTSDTNQSFTLSLEKGVHYLTVIAAEYQLPAVGDTIDEVQLLWEIDQHVFYVIEDAGDPLPTVTNNDIYLSTIANPYSEIFEISNGIPYEHPNVKISDVILADPTAPIVIYDYNVSTDDNFEASDGSMGYAHFTRVGNGETKWWVNDNPFANAPQQLHNDHNYIYICAVSTKPEDFLVYFFDTYFPTLEICSTVLDIFVETDATETTYITEVTTETTVITTDYTTTPTTVITTTTTVPGENEASFPQISVIIIAFISICFINLLRIKIKGGNKR
ncbi:MAG: hypothetical protein H7645_03790 [Candidatus Heimdallarchaeota archaeon]|nr:hypothetical protein [Candidatus Heimdallarchaeota archaeon]MCK4769438.1 hypothetical protein [Candidatus Heimdallarchaeota archaeon]